MFFCDFSKGFDKVWHRGLLHKIPTYGITGNMLISFSNYLHGHRQIVLKSSVFCEVSAGVLQGSGIVPLLFILCINDVANNHITE